MNLVNALLLMGSFLVLAGGLLLSGKPTIERACKAFPRHKWLGYVLFALGAGWFLWRVAHLSQADEIGFISREFMLYFFVLVAVLTLPFLPDFLAVRGAAILYLMSARLFLEAGWMQYGAPQRALNATVYVGILIALLLGASPYRLRDFFHWLFCRRTRQLLLGGALVGHGLLLGALAFSLI